LLEMPPGMGVTGLESDGADRFFCGGGGSGTVRSIRRPKRGSAAKPNRQGRAEGADNAADDVHCRQYRRRRNGRTWGGMLPSLKIWFRRVSLLPVRPMKVA